MAFGKGRETKEVVIKRYVGYAPVKVLGVNLSKEQLSEIYGREVTKDRVYTGTVDVNGVSVDRATLSFVVKCELEGKEFITTANFNLRNEKIVGAESGKTQVVDEYGRTAWVTPEELENHAIPQYKNGPANITANYRPLYRGEETLTLFLQRLLAIPNVTKFVDGKPAGLIDNPEDAECRLEHISDYFNGDFSEIEEILSYQPENKVTLLFGVRKGQDNNLYQDVFTDFAMLSNARNLAKFDEELKAAKAGNRYADTNFGEDKDGHVYPLTEYVETPTTFSSNAPSASAPSGGNPWFTKQS